MTAILSIGLVFAATFTIFAYLAFIWWLDRYEREPLWLVALTFSWGALGGTFLGALFTAPFAIVSSKLLENNVADVLTSVVFAPSIEEATKAMIFLLLILLPHFDNETDGLIYGAATGLGFACVENWLYFSNTNSLEELASLVILRTAFTALVHAISSSLIGMSFGFVRSRQGSWISSIAFIFLGYILAVANHATWNAVASLTGVLGMEGGGSAVFLFGVLVIMGGALTLFILTQYSVFREHKAIARILTKEALYGTLPAAHAAIIPFWGQRKKKDWVNPRIDRKAYIRIATKLAFRLHQLERYKTSSKREKAGKEILSLRTQIQTMLNP